MIASCGDFLDASEKPEPHLVGGNQTPEYLALLAIPDRAVVSGYQWLQQFATVRNSSQQFATVRNSSYCPRFQTFLQQRIDLYLRHRKLRHVEFGD